MSRTRWIAALLAATALMACDSKPWHCDADHDCDGTDLCRVSTGECVPLSSAECRRDGDCIDPGEACWDLACVARCTTGADCADAARDCVEGRCIPRAAGADLP